MSAAGPRALDETADDYVVEQFVLEESGYAELARLVESAFLSDAAQAGGTIAFTEGTFRLMFGSPSMPRDLFVRAVHRQSGQVVGFLGGIPRSVSCRGRVYRLGVPAWAAVHPAHQRQALARRMGMKLLSIAKEKGFDGGFAFFEPEAHGVDMAGSVAREAGFRARELARIQRFLIRVFDVEAARRVAKLRWFERLGLRLLASTPLPRRSRVRRARPDDAERMYELLADHVARNQLAALREREDFAWYLANPDLIAVVHEDEQGLVDGYVVAWKMHLAGFGHAVPFGWLDLVHTHRLERPAAVALVRLLCCEAKTAGWVGLQMPFIPYFDPRPFLRARFVFFPKQLVVSLLDFGGIDLPEQVESYYFDWR